MERDVVIPLLDVLTKLGEQAASGRLGTPIHNLVVNTPTTSPRAALHVLAEERVVYAELSIGSVLNARLKNDTLYLLLGLKVLLLHA